MCKRSTKESILARFGVVFVKLRGCANQSGLIRALFFNHLMDSQKGQHQIINIFWYFSYLVRIWRNKRYKNQQRQMKTPRVRKCWTPRERNRNTGREEHIHNKRFQGEKGTFWMWEMGTSLHAQNWYFSTLIMSYILCVCLTDKWTILHLQGQILFPSEQL